MSNLHFPGQHPARQGSFLPCFPEEGVIPRVGCPLLAKSVPAGLPSPATDLVNEHLSLDRHLIEHREATFLVRVAGHSMTGFGIHDGDLLVVDRRLAPADRSVVIAVVDGAFTVKQLCRIPQGILLRAGARESADILIAAEQDLAVWGVVRWSIHAV